MPATTKRLDLRFGSFACSVQGFDDPVMPVQQVLRAIQHLLEETPELSDAGISFDAEAIESLIEEVARRADLASEDIEITPGLVIVHRGENNPSAGFSGLDHGEGQGADREAWARPFTGGGDAAAAGADQPAYVNIFAAQGADDGGEDFDATAELARDDLGADDLAADRPEEASEEDLVAARLERAYGGLPETAGAAAAPPRDIFAETGGGFGGGVFADPMAKAAAAPGPDDDDEEPLNLFAPAGSPAGEAGEARPDENIFSSFDAPRDADEDLSEDSEDHRVQSLFGDTEDQPETAEATDGYTVAGLVQAAGAETVADMMVCAAAWLVLLKGDVSFTRREVMDAFDQIPGEHEKTLEARIKGFGRAVRNGQLAMVEDGVFGLSQSELDRFERLL